MELIDRNDSLISTELDRFDFDNPPIDPEELATEMVKFMRKSNGIGLAANQVGHNFRVFAMEGEPAFVCFNPKIVINGDELVTLEEGCLTYPGLYVKIKRPKVIKVRFQGPDGEVYTKTFTGMTSRIFQHELDHLDGIVFYSRANRFHRDAAFKKWKQWKRKNESV
jgi:peptide deformylase